jgi:hypothetical protein
MRMKGAILGLDGFGIVSYVAVHGLLYMYEEEKKVLSPF